MSNQYINYKKNGKILKEKGQQNKDKRKCEEQTKEKAPLSSKQYSDWLVEVRNQIGPL